MLKRISRDKYEVLKQSINKLISSTVSKIYESIDILVLALDNALKYGITVYDSLFVTLALINNCKLVSFDENLAEKLKQKELDIILIP